MTVLLEIDGLQKHFGALQVTRDVTLTLEKGARHALIGPNGAGKTTLINLVTGFLAPSAGRIRLAGEDITALGQAERVKRGIARTFQINQLFLGLSVLDNVALAVAERTGTAWSLLRGARASAGVADEALDYLDRLSLTADARIPVRELPYGRQRLVEIAIALALEPRVLLLDEPAAGVPSTESHIILDAVASLPADMAILIIEHDMDVVFQFARRITVLVGGAVLVEGPPDAIAADPQVRAVYLGEGDHG
jgi:branched-chain amino acid transport system ATP-binding protein